MQGYQESSQRMPNDSVTCCPRTHCSTVLQLGWYCAELLLRLAGLFTRTFCLTSFEKKYLPTCSFPVRVQLTNNEPLFFQISSVTQATNSSQITLGMISLSFLLLRQDLLSHFSNGQSYDITRPQTKIDYCACRS